MTAIIFPRKWKLRPQDEVVLSMLLSGADRIVSDEAIFERLYGRNECRSATNISSRLHLLRKRVPGLKIEAHRGLGHSIPCDVRKRLLAECEAEERRRLTDLHEIAVDATREHLSRMNAEIAWCKQTLRRLSQIREQFVGVKDVGRSNPDSERDLPQRAPERVLGSGRVGSKSNGIRHHRRGEFERALHAHA